MPFVPGQTVGIDLGTSFSAVSQLDADGNPVVIRNSQGKLISASVVVLGAGQNVYVNPSKPLGSYSNAQGVITAIKRQMGNPLYYLMYEGRRINPEFISSLILRRVKLDAEQEIGPVANAVITVPYYFNDICRRATRNAGKIAGLNVVDLLNEPTAATLTYAWMNNELGNANLKAPEKKILVYDLGGGTFDVTVVRYTPTNFRVMATDGDTLLGGMEWTERIVNYVSDRFKEKFGLDPRSTTASLLNLRAECEQAKQELSQRTQTLIQVNLEGRTIMVGLTRQEFERMTADLLQRTRDTTELVLELSNTRPSDLDEVLLVGGSTYMPGVIRMLREVCGREPSTALAPQLAVAQGAAIHAAILEARERGEVSHMGQLVLKRLRSVRTVDVNSHSLGVEITDPRIPDLKRNHIMIPRNQMLPYSIKQRFVTTRSNPEGILIRLLEGEASDVAACTFIGECRIEGLPRGLPEGSPVEVTYSYDAERRIRVTARELTTRTAAEVLLQKEGYLDPTVIEAFQTLARQYQAE